MTVEEWVEAYARAWREKDAAAVVELFTEDADPRTAVAARFGSTGTWRQASASRTPVGVSDGQYSKSSIVYVVNPYTISRFSVMCRMLASG
jgi:hypothetical protein